ncbi:pesticin C-terminus-like muramidase [Acidovorax sp. PRC11]|uniref:pesticin C-terminus-like muramidase n=1 Tax=Acidovorax sp. PRC11 TaxID=2962592 RepID=UPI002882C11E|nr:pesticin C-terminus-like muramidase [Acidovorax sp. PRC11]MDT0140228.1 pesticin C-terminus-like muramidase [Acidovorax sp. PRC11]
MALKEEDLPDYDKDALSRERALRKTAEECRQEQEKAKAELPGLKKERQKLDRKAEGYAEEARRLDQEITEKEGKLKRKCLTGNVACLPADETKKGTLNLEIAKIINASLGTKIDLAPIARWEGVYLQSYVPWWPVNEPDGGPSMTKRDGDTRLQGKMKNGDLNNSGVTVAKGIDFGQQNYDRYKIELKFFNERNSILSKEDLDLLMNKIKPYFGKIGGEACAFARKNLLEITQKEADLLNLRAGEEATRRAIELFEKKNPEGSQRFIDLTTEQQTALLSNVYQSWSINPKMKQAILEGDREKIPDSRRERDYLYASMPSKKTDDK